MNDDTPLKPWLDDPSAGSDVRDLLRFGQIDGPSDADLARLASRLAPAVGLVALAAPAQALAETVAPENPAGFAPAQAAVAQGFAFKAFLPGLIKAVAVVGTVGLTAMLWPRAPTQPTTQPVAHTERRVIEDVVAPPEPAPSQLAPEAPAAQVEAPLVETTPPAPAKAKLERRAKPAPKAEPVQALSTESELTLIRRAQELRSQPGEMLSVLQAHERTYPNGMLAQEREVLAIEALLATGKRADAEKRATRMEQRFSDSAHLRRVRVLLETSTPE